MQATRQKTAVSILPKQSQAMCKNMTKLCVSSILSRRRLLNEACFKSKPFANGILADQLDCMSKDSNDAVPEAKKGKSAEETRGLMDGALLQQWLEQGVFDAIDNRYLRSLSFIVAKEENEGEGEGEEANVIESYTFKYEYSKEGECMVKVGEGEDESQATDVCTKESMIEQCAQLLRGLNMLSDTLAPPPGNRNLLLKLKYHPDTPDDYEPEYFRSSSSSAYSKFISKTKKIEFNGFKSPHNGLSMTFTAANWLFEDESGSEDEAQGELLEEEEEEQEDPYSSAEVEELDTNVSFRGQDMESLTMQSQSEEYIKPPSSTPSRGKRNTKSIQAALAKPKESQDLNTKFSNLNTSCAHRSLKDVMPTKEDDEVTRLDDDDDETKTRLDDDIESDDEEADLTQLEGVKPGLETVILDHLHGKKSACVSIIAIVTKIDELTVSAILAKLLKQGLVEKVGTRWCEVSSSAENESEMDVDSICSFSSQHLQSQSEHSQKKKYHSRSPLVAPTPLPPVAAARSLPSVMKPNRSAPPALSMMSPPQITSMTGRKRNGSLSSGSGFVNQLNDAQDDDIEYYAFSQDSMVSSQGRSKYSIVEHPIRQQVQAKKRSRTVMPTRSSSRL